MHAHGGMKQRSCQERHRPRPFQPMRQHGIREPEREDLCIGTVREHGGCGPGGGEGRAVLGVRKILSGRDRAEQGLVACKLKGLGNVQDNVAGEGRGVSAQGEPSCEQTPGGTGIIGGAAQIKGIAQFLFVFAAPNDAGTGDCGFEGEPAPPDAGKGLIHSQNL
jgi:hypothetical protein